MRRQLGCDADVRAVLESAGKPCGKPVPPPSLEAGVGNLGLGQARWVHPEGERLDMRWVHFDERDRLAG